MTRRTGLLWLLLTATAFGTNHVAARLAFDHGVSVPTAVAARSMGTAVLVLWLIRQAGLALPREARTWRRGALIGLLVSSQSLCLSSAVARMPVALALLVFNTFPIVLALMSWASGGERPGRRALVAMPMALAGLALALGGRPGAFTGHEGHDIVGGSLLALGASASFGGALLLTTRWLGAVDGRVRSLMMMGVVISVSLLFGALTNDFRGPRDAPGWIGLALLVVLYSGAITSLFVVLPRMGAVNNAAVMNVEPVAALLMGWLVLGQTVSGWQMVGAAIVIAAIVTLSGGPPPSKR